MTPETGMGDIVEVLDKYLVLKKPNVGIIGLGRGGEQVARGIARHEQVNTLTLCGKEREQFTQLREDILSTGTEKHPEIRWKQVIDYENDRRGHPRLINIGEVLADNDIIFFTLGSSTRLFEEEAIQGLMADIPGFDQKLDYRVTREFAGSVLPTISFAEQVAQYSSLTADKLFIMFNNPPEITAGVFARATGLHHNTLAMSNLCQYRLQRSVFGDVFLALWQKVRNTQLDSFAYEALTGFMGNNGMCYGVHGEVVPIASTILDKSSRNITYASRALDGRYRKQMEAFIADLPYAIGSFALRMRDNEKGKGQKNLGKLIGKLEERIRKLRDDNPGSQEITGLEAEYEHAKDALQELTDPATTIRKQCEPAVMHVLTALAHHDLTQPEKAVFLGRYGDIKDCLPAEADYPAFIDRFLPERKPFFFGCPVLGPYTAPHPAPVEAIGEEEMQRIVKIYRKWDTIDSRVTGWLTREGLLEVREPTPKAVALTAKDIAKICDLRARLYPETTVKAMEETLMTTGSALKGAQDKLERLLDENTRLQNESAALKQRIAAIPHLDELELLAKHPEIIAAHGRSGNLYLVDPVNPFVVTSIPGYLFCGSDEKKLIGVTATPKDFLITRVYPDGPKILGLSKERVHAVYPLDDGVIAYQQNSRKAREELVVLRHETEQSIVLPEGIKYVTFTFVADTKCYALGTDVLTVYTFHVDGIAKHTFRLEKPMDYIMGDSDTIITVDAHHDVYTTRLEDGKVRCTPIATVTANEPFAVAGSSFFAARGSRIEEFDVANGGHRHHPLLVPLPCTAMVASSDFLYTGGNDLVGILNRSTYEGFIFHLPIADTVQGLYCIRGGQHAT